MFCSRFNALAFLLATVLVGCTDRSFQGTPIDPPKAVPTFEFANVRGAPLIRVPEPGRVSLLFFGYTNCPDVCPTTLSDWKRVRTALGSDADRVHFVFVSVDPDRDTPQSTQQFVAGFDTSFTGVVGDSALLEAMQHAYSVSSMRMSNQDNMPYQMGHASQVFLLDERGRIVAVYSPGAGWDAMARDIGRLL